MTATATEVKNRFGEFLDRAQREAVTVEKSGRPVAVLVSQEEYDRLTALEDRYWGERALAAAKERTSAMTRRWQLYWHAWLR